MKGILALCTAFTLNIPGAASGSQATSVGALHFEIEHKEEGPIKLNLRRLGDPDQSFKLLVAQADFVGLANDALIAKKDMPIGFALVREAGRFDCVGLARSSHGHGTCRFTQDRGFSAFLVASGMSRPTSWESLSLAVLSVERSLVDALRSGGFDMPAPDILASIKALGITPAYIRAMSEVGYKPPATSDFIKLKALDISAEYMQSMKSVGYERLPVDELLQLKAVGITGDFIGKYRRQGYQNLSVSQLIQMKTFSLEPSDLDK